MTVMRKYFIIIALIAAALTGNAHDFNVKSIEGGIYVGGGFPTDRYHDCKSQPNVLVGLDLRYNLKSLPVDVGIFTEWDFTFRKRPDTATIFYPDDEGNTQSVTYPTLDDQVNRNWLIGVVGNWNFGQGRKINPYLGLGIATSSYKAISGSYYDTEGLTLSLTPRAGVELWHHFRIGLQDRSRAKATTRSTSPSASPSVALPANNGM